MEAIPFWISNIWPVRPSVLPEHHAAAFLLNALRESRENHLRPAREAGSPPRVARGPTQPLRWDLHLARPPRKRAAAAMPRPCSSQPWPPPRCSRPCRRGRGSRRRGHGWEKGGLQAKAGADLAQQRTLATRCSPTRDEHEWILAVSAAVLTMQQGNPSAVRYGELRRRPLACSVSESCRLRRKHHALQAAAVWRVVGEREAKGSNWPRGADHLPAEGVAEAIAKLVGLPPQRQGLQLLLLFRLER